MTTGAKSEKENPNRVSEPLSEAYLLAAAKGGCSTSFDACHKAIGDSVLASTTGKLEMPRSKMKAAIMNIVVIGGSGLIRPRLDTEVCVNAPCGVRS